MREQDYRADARAAGSPRPQALVGQAADRSRPRARSARRSAPTSSPGASNTTRAAPIIARCTTAGWSRRMRCRREGWAKQRVDWLRAQQEWIRANIGEIEKPEPIASAKRVGGGLELSASQCYNRRMNKPLKLIPIGNSTGVILPKDMLQRTWRRAEATALFALRTPNGSRIRRVRPRVRRADGLAR